LECGRACAGARTGLPGLEPAGPGEDLPRDLYLQWRRWCRWPRYFFDDPDLPGLEALFAQVRTPIVAVNALDDRWALPASRDAFMAAYRGAVVERVDLDPRSLGLRAIGHFSYFRPEAIELWRATLACLSDGGPWPIGAAPAGTGIR
jgi:predicted alpha/beta hydrolase